MIYMDYMATTPVDERVLARMLPFFKETFGNPASAGHAFGWEAQEAVDRGRADVAALIGAQADEVVFTSGATEANNLALKGVFEALGATRPHLVTLATEHKAVLDPCRYLEQRGARVTVLGVDADGLVDLDALAAALTPDTALVSVMAANNEIGTLQDMVAIGRLCRERGVLFHSDATQAVGKVPVDVNAWQVDLLSLSAHKMYGPKGIGALYVRRKLPARLVPLLHGGGHERRLRSGTLNVPGIVGLGEACRLAGEELPVEAKRLRGLRDRLHTRLREALPEVYLNGHAERRLPGTLHLSFRFVESESLALSIQDVAVSAGSACTSGDNEPSHVLRALGRDDELLHAGLRFGLGRFTTVAEVETVAQRVIAAVERLRELSPLWHEFLQAQDSGAETDA